MWWNRPLTALLSGTNRKSRCQCAHGQSFWRRQARAPLTWILSSLLMRDVLQNAFGFDTGAIEVDWSKTSLKLGFLNLSDPSGSDEFTFDFPDLPDLTLKSGWVNWIFLSHRKGIKDLASNLLAGYNDYAVEHPEADYSHLDEYLMAITNSGGTTDFRRRHQADHPIRFNGHRFPSSSRSWCRTLCPDSRSAASNGWTDPDRFSEYLALYPQTPEAQQIIAEGAADVLQISGEITISPEQIQALISGIMSGYQEYAIANQLPDPSKMASIFPLIYRHPRPSSR